MILCDMLRAGGSVNRVKGNIRGHGMFEKREDINLQIIINIDDDGTAANIICFYISLKILTEKYRLQ